MFCNIVLGQNQVTLKIANFLIPMKDLLVLRGSKQFPPELFEIDAYLNLQVNVLRFQDNNPQLIFILSLKLKKKLWVQRISS